MTPKQTTANDRLAAAVRTLANADAQKNISALQRKLSQALVRRDEWKERATWYRKQLLETKNVSKL